MIRDEILEYPYSGVIKRTYDGRGDEPDYDVVIYEGVMDETVTQNSDGNLKQTVSYIVSIPLTKDANNGYIIPKKGDKVFLERYGESITFVVDNAEPSQLGGVSIYVTRKAW